MEDQEVYLLITRYLSKQTTLDENEKLADWIALSKGNETEFENIKTIWLAGSSASDALSALSALHKTKEKYGITDVAPYPAQKKTRGNRWYYWGAAAATITIFCLLFLFRYTSENQSGAIVYIEKNTLPKQKLKLILADSTVVYLAPESRLRYPETFAGDKRQVFLEGEAFFEVKRDTLHPFLVTTELLTTRVLGTSFNIDAFAGSPDIRISLFSGKVEVSKENEPEHSYALHPGQQLLYDRNEGRIYRQDFNEATVNGWITNKLVFRNTPLEEAARKIEKLYSVKIVLIDKDMADRQLWASFENESLEKVLGYLKMAGGVHFRKEGDVIYLTSKKGM
ncbi:FecR family protein [Parapedobacter tibetensis]|uniref:FecR family protein n=1 Tax=Parapedobacter tibetensis TaxID=2972951 RepID=UPI00214DA8BE|nr:FecR domain-containing protein [Parapedobacter tibetensis]